MTIQRSHLALVAVFVTGLIAGITVKPEPSIAQTDPSYLSGAGNGTAYVVWNGRLYYCDRGSCVLTRFP